ncbi:MAG: MBOAT family protein [Clostridia bacterium]|nr:MBOAT family protein [Clostridia bacterium]
MLFSSVTFLYYFLPVLLILYFLVPRRFKNVVLLVSSLFFYAWGEPIYLLLMIAETAVGFIAGLFIEKFRGRIGSKIAMIGSVVVCIGALALFKYTDFFIGTLNGITGLALPLLKIALPVGISFYTFQILSYTIDLYRGNAAVQNSILDFATYVTLFPQLIAGPIVRYTDVAAELKERQITLEGFAAGVSRFTVGLAKKVLLANTLGELCSIYKASDEKSVLFVWIYAVSYALHIYFDFSGYSDMAIGLGRMMGFHFIENFNYPYISKSITEFWRRWHISLGSWFRDYVYIPLGGNRCSKLRHVFNILVVWMLTGFWHGAGWNFILWGLWFALFLLLEKYVFFKVWDRIPTVFVHIYSLVIVLFGWVLFDALTLGDALGTAGAMVGIGGLAGVTGEALYYLQSYALPLLIGAVGATPLPKKVWNLLEEHCKPLLTFIEPAATAVLLVIVTGYLVDGSFNPFIYFRF